MCGLTGYYTKNNIHENKIISEMSNSLISRGPDDIGYWVDNSIGISLDIEDYQFKIYLKMDLNLCLVIQKEM